MANTNVSVSSIDDRQQGSLQLGFTQYTSDSKHLRGLLGYFSIAPLQAKYMTNGAPDSIFNPWDYGRDAGVFCRLAPAEARGMLAGLTAVLDGRAEWTTTDLYPGVGSTTTGSITVGVEDEGYYVVLNKSHNGQTHEAEIWFPAGNANPTTVAYVNEAEAVDVGISEVNPDLLTLLDFLGSVATMDVSAVAVFASATDRGGSQAAAAPVASRPGAARAGRGSAAVEATRHAGSSRRRGPSQAADRPAAVTPQPTAVDTADDLASFLDGVPAVETTGTLPPDLLAPVAGEDDY